MPESKLLALSPIDGRYANKTEPLRAFFSEYGLMRYRVHVEIAWFKHLAGQPDVPELKALEDADKSWLNELVQNFSLNDALAVKKIEATTNHDVKAVEYFLKQRLAERPSLAGSVEFVHFACTSEDINNLSYALMLSDARRQVLLPAMQKIIAALTQMAEQFSEIPMLSRTHGQAATPTTMGKELANTVWRLSRQLQQFEAAKILGKLNGTVGNYNAHLAAYPEADWPRICKAFVESSGVEFNAYTTQIEPHDYIAEYCHILGRFNRVLIDYNQDTWGYIALGYFSQRIQPQETGSSVMPHKVNPIDFENSEGNLSLAGALFELFARQLTVSRWQRDLTDSTLLRNLGVGLAHSLIGWHAALAGIDKLELNQEQLQADLEQAWEVLAEPIQTLMRKHGISKPYERLKAMTRGQSFNGEEMRALIQGLELPEDAKRMLANLEPAAYRGLAGQLAAQVREQTKK